MKRTLENGSLGNPTKKRMYDKGDQENPSFVGSKIDVLWEHEHKWYRGEIMEYNEQTNVAVVFYDHETIQETVNLNQRQYKFVVDETNEVGLTEVNPVNDLGTVEKRELQEEPSGSGFEAADLLLQNNAVYPTHIERHPEEEELQSSAILRFETFGNESGVNPMTLQEYKKWKQEQQDEIKRANMDPSQFPETENIQTSDVLREYHCKLEFPKKTSALPSFFSYRCPKTMKEFNRLRDLEMYTGWAHTRVVVPIDWNGLKCVDPEILPERGLKFACPFIGCNRGAHSQQEIWEHICRHHDISDPTKPKKRKEATPRILRKRIEVPVDIEETTPLNLEFFKHYEPPGHACQADAMMKHFVKKLLCSDKDMEANPESLPPRPAQPLNLPHMELTAPDPSWFVQDMMPQTDYYEVEAVVNDRLNEQTQETEYLVKWKGYDEPTWEPPRVISHLPMYAEYLQNKETSAFPETVKTEAIESAQDPSIYQSNVFI